jgi:hypothetical protein
MQHVFRPELVQFQREQQLLAQPRSRFMTPFKLLRKAVSIHQTQPAESSAPTAKLGD